MQSFTKSSLIAIYRQSNSLYLKKKYVYYVYAL